MASSCSESTLAGLVPFLIGEFEPSANGGEYVSSKSMSAL